MKQKSINTIKQGKILRKRNRVISILLVAIIVIASSVVTVSARTNSWGLNVSQAATSYFVNSQMYLTSGWSVNRQNAWIECKNTTTKFNTYVVTTDPNLNAIKLLEELYTVDANKAVELGTKWNQECANVQNLNTEASEQCAYGSLTVTLYNGTTVTEEMYDSLYNNAKDISKEIDDLFKEIQQAHYTATYKPSNMFNETTNYVFMFFDKLWSALGTVLMGFGLVDADVSTIFGTSFTTASIETFANSISGIVKTFAYAIVCILFAVNVTTTSLQYELLTLRGGVKVFARVILAKFWVDLAIPICMYSLRIINSLAAQILLPFFSPTSVIFGSYGGPYTSPQVDNAWWDFIGVIVNFLASLFNFLPMLILIVVVFICIAAVFVKIIARCFELTCLVSLSPLFFATLIGDETSRYFKKFFGAFLSTASYIVYLTIVYAVCSTWIADITTYGIVGNWGDFLGAFATVCPRTIVLIAICYVMWKPPKVLTSLIE